MHGVEAGQAAEPELRCASGGLRQFRMHTRENQAGEEKETVHPEIAAPDQAGKGAKRGGEIGVQIDVIGEDPGGEDRPADREVDDFRAAGRRAGGHGRFK